MKMGTGFATQDMECYESKISWVFGTKDIGVQSYRNWCGVVIDLFG